MRLSQKDMWSDVPLLIRDTLTLVPPVERQHPPHCVSVVELGKPVVLPVRMGRPGKRAAKRVKGQRAWDRGASKRRAVIIRIGHNVLYPKGALTSAWCGMARAYAESPVITGTSKELLEEGVKPCVEAFLAERGLQLLQEKTRITHISEGFDFLGQNVRKYGGKLLIKPSAKNIKTFLENVRETIRSNRSMKQETLISLLNPMIRGWANYHRHVVAKKTYAVVDHHIWQALWRWARRRHPRKSSAWVRKNTSELSISDSGCLLAKPESIAANRERRGCIQLDLRRYFKSVGAVLGNDPTIMNLLVGQGR